MVRNLSDYRSGLSLRLGVSSVMYEDSDLDEALNNAIFDMSERAEHLNRLFSVDMRKNVSRYLVGDTIIKAPYRAWHSNVNRPCEMTTMEKVEIDHPGWETSSGPTVEEVYIFDIRTIGVYPIPSADTGILYLEFPRCSHKMVESTDIAETPVEFEEALYDYAIFWLKLDQDNDEFMLGLSRLQRFGDRVGGSPARENKPDSMRAWAKSRTRDRLKNTPRW